MQGLRDVSVSVTASLGLALFLGSESHAMWLYAGSQRCLGLSHGKSWSCTVLGFKVSCHVVVCRVSEMSQSQSR